MRSLTAAVVVGFVFVAASRAAGAAGASPEAKSLFEAMLHQRLLLKSGEYRIENGHEHAHSRDEKPSDAENPFSVFCAFDQARLRFDRTDGTTFRFPARLDRAGRPILPIVRKYFRTPQGSGNWIGGDKWILSAAPNAPAESDPFDIRALGIYTEPDFCRGTTIDVLIADMLKSWQSAKVDALPGNVKLLTLAHTDEDNPAEPNCRFKIWVDVARGFVPIRSEVADNEGSGWHVELKSEAKWELREGVWVPIHVVMDFETSDGQSQLRREFTVHWASVNSPISDTLFTCESFGVGVPIRHFGDSMGAHIPAARSAGAGGESAAQSNVARSWLIAENFLLAAVLIVALCVWPSRARRAKPMQS